MNYPHEQNVKKYIIHTTYKNLVFFVAGSRFNWFKGVFSKPSGKLIVAPFFSVRDFKVWLLAYFLNLLNCAKFKPDWTNLKLDIL